LPQASAFSGAGIFQPEADLGQGLTSLWLARNPLAENFELITILTSF